MAGDESASGLLRSFLDVSLQLSLELDVERALAFVVERSMEFTGARYGAVATVDSSGAFDRFVHDGLSEDEIARLPRLPEAKGLLGEVLSSRAPVRCERISDHPASVGFPAGYVAMEAFLGVPLMQRGDLIGALYLTKARGFEPFTLADEELITAMGAIGAAAITNARLHEAEAERARRRALLSDIAWKVRHSLEVTDVLWDAVAALGSAADADRCYIRLVREPGGTRLGPIEVEWDAPGVEPLDPSGTFQYPMASLAAESRTTQWSVDVGADPRFADPELVLSVKHLLERGAQAALATPLEWGEEFMGVVTFQSLRPRKWSTFDIELIEGGAREVSVALHHARLYYEARDRAEKLKELDALRTEFVSMVSHELRSPMTVVSGIAHLMRWRGERLDEGQRDQLLETLERESRRLTRLVSEFLDLEAIERGKIELALDQVDLADLAAEAMIDAGLASRTSMEMVGDSCTVDADRDRIKQVILNLLSNAAKFSPEGSPIDLKVVANGRHVTLSVSDRGPGIGEKDRTRLFERFSRLAATGQRSPGSGIGLYVSKTIIDLHGGDIWVESVAGKGATFSFRLLRRT